MNGKPDEQQEEQAKGPGIKAQRWPGNIVMTPGRGIQHVQSVLQEGKADNDAWNEEGALKVGDVDGAVGAAAGNYLLVRHL